ncbi:MAG: tetratricopeptide repeat protein [Pseudomonadota bacterium]
MIELLQRGAFAPALQSAQAALQTDPDDPDLHQAAGIAALNLGDPNRAVAGLATSLELRPDDAHCRRQLGALYHQLGRPEDALRVYEAFADRADALPDDHYRLAVLLQDAGDQRRAETYNKHVRRICCGTPHHGAALQDHRKDYDATPTIHLFQCRMKGAMPI